MTNPARLRLGSENLDTALHLKTLTAHTGQTSPTFHHRPFIQCVCVGLVLR